MTTNTGLAEPAPTSGGDRQEAREARRRQRVVTVKRVATERGFPVLEWYRAQGQQESRGSA